jgi:hypothetical protein
MTRILAIVLFSALLFGCDPAHQGYVRLQSSPSTRSTAAITIKLPAEHVAGSLAVLDGVAAENDFRAEPLSTDVAQSGWLRNYSRSYARYPEQGIYRRVALKAHLRQSEGLFEIVVWEFVASRESDFGRQLRLALESRLRQRFPDAHVTSHP